MKIEALTMERIKDFVDYCKKHRTELDDSFLADRNLEQFTPDNENPTYILTDQNGEIRAAASLLIDEYNRRGKKARFRIFHSEINNITCYNLLMQALLRHGEGLKQYIIFIPYENDNLKSFIERLNFSLERNIFLLVREEQELPGYSIPADYSIRDFRPGYDEVIWSKVRNAGFATLQGNETPVSPEMVAKMVLSDAYLHGGMKILFHKENPIGVVRGADDEYEDGSIMNIGPLAILPQYQGKGLGRILLRAALEFAKEKSYKRTVLSVNSENERAKTLYLAEGFKQVEGVTCYHYDLS